ncbi:hypothetical protein [Shewanella algae]|uniref:hypothetical protein n=1 Tax=Shewanella algae TaxID=38313 RepID=UPI000B8B7062|nr:hypothetical protein [Shewanella algae]OXR99726.1 hypothetical protein AMR44_16290 [Shewanella algae]
MDISYCEQKIDDINTLIAQLLNDKNSVFFEKVNVIRPNSQNKELSFVRLVTWLYTLYYEAGKNPLKVIKSSMSNSSKELYNAHSKRVNSFRTKLHHNLDRASSRDFKIESDYHKWMKSVCNRNIPTSELEWEQCSAQLLQEAHDVLSKIAYELELMTDTPTQKEIFTFNWVASKEKSLAPYIYDNLIKNSLHYINQKNIDIVSYRKKYYEEWNANISLLNSESNYEEEASKIIESSIVKDFYIRLPVTIEVLSQHFSLSYEFIFSLLVYLRDFDASDLNDEEIIENFKTYLSEYLLEQHK